MTTLRKASQEYVELRRNLGFTLRLPAGALRSFVAFAEGEDASYITTDFKLTILNNSQSSRVITPIFQPPQSIQDDRRCILGTYVTYNSTHGVPSKLSIDRVAFLPGVPPR